MSRLPPLVLALLVMWLDRFLTASASDATLANSVDETFGVSLFIHKLFHFVESGKLKLLTKKSKLLQEKRCLLGVAYCRSGASNTKQITIPTSTTTTKSLPPPEAKNKEYQRLATVAEEAIPRTWFRDNYADPKFLLTRTANDYPNPLYSKFGTNFSSKRLRNICQCVTRQNFIRFSFSFTGNAAASGQKSPCIAITDEPFASFYTEWTAYRAKLGSKSVGRIIINSEEAADSLRALFPPKSLVDLAGKVSDHFLSQFGGIWTGCFPIKESSSCRGAFSAAIYVTALRILQTLLIESNTEGFATSSSSSSSSNNDVFDDELVAKGYLFVSIARALLHGDTDSTGNIAITKFSLIPNDIIVMQQIYLKIYIDNYGKEYSRQLDAYIPIVIPPTFEVRTKHGRAYNSFANDLEPIYTSLRNWMYTESKNLIDFGPYRPITIYSSVRDDIKRRKRVLIDVGANGFYASPKYLIDSYAPILPFTDVIMIEPEPHFSESVPAAYKKRYNVTFIKEYIEVNTNSRTDIVKMLPQLVSKDDFVVLKFDVDPNKFAQGPTMEWGFLFSLMRDQAASSLVDELYIEMHFNLPELYWNHYHSNWEALDLFRYLRKGGMIVHSWP